MIHARHHRAKIAGTLRRVGLLEAARSIRRISNGFVMDARWFLGPAPRRRGDDGLPVPPPHLCFLVSANYSTDYFMRTSAQSAESIRGTLLRNGLEIGSFRSILDFGCGCGRTARRWKDLKDTTVCGTDIQASLVRWADRHLPFARFSCNGLSSILPYGDGQFDFVYAISVFTHLDQRLQSWWRQELARVLKPNGHLLFTVKGRDVWKELSPEETERFARGELVIQESGSSGSNYCAAFHPDEYVRRTLADGFDVIASEPGGSQDTQQDFWLFRKR